MSKSKPGIDGVHDDSHLFRGIASRHRRRLFLGRYLDEESRKPIYETKDRDAAHKILIKWADLESAGHLQRKETALDASFLHEVFGQALHYTLGTQSPSRYFLERQFTVPGIGTADGALGEFPPAAPEKAVAIIELKDAGTDLDHDRSNNRTPVQQCWDYLYHLPGCPWGIVSNFVSFRLYHRDKTPQAFEHFELQKLRDLEQFARFYCLFERDSLVPSKMRPVPAAVTLLNRSANRQREVGEKLYNYYDDQRFRLIGQLIDRHQFAPDDALRAAQKLLDRIIFIAFCEDRGLLPERLIQYSVRNVGPLARVTNPRWRNFLDVFHAIDKGHPNLELPTGYNGGLFQHDKLVDDLDLDDSWATVFDTIGDYDFAEDVNVDVLGHIFEKSVADLERLRQGGVFFASSTQGPSLPAMPKSAERKRFGIYYTPPEFTRYIVDRTVGLTIDQRFAALAEKHGVDLDEAPKSGKSVKLAAFWQACFDALTQIRVCDPACGSGAFLIEAYEQLEDRYEAVAGHLARAGGKNLDTLLARIPDHILHDNLYGVDLSQEAVEITQLALWIRSARKGRTLADLTGNIICGNSLVAEASVHPRALDWRKAFPKIFTAKGGGFDCVIGNPPWERLKLQEREFFAAAAPHIATAVNAAERRRLIETLKKDNPALEQRYRAAQEAADRMLTHARQSGDYPLTGQGDINTYMLFAELARKLIHDSGRVGLLVPSGIATDATTKEFFQDLIDKESLAAFYDFENRKKVFPDVDGRFKFCIFLAVGSSAKVKDTDFVFFAHEIEHLNEKKRHIALSRKDLALFNPNTLTCPIFRSRRDAELTREIYRRVPVLINQQRKSGGNPWGVRFARMFDQTNDAEHFTEGKMLKERGFTLDGNRWRKKKELYLPLYEAKMVQAYDHRAASVLVEKGNWVRQGQKEETSLVEHQNPEFAVLPRYWVAEEHVRQALAEDKSPAWIAYKDVTSPTNTRTMIAAWIPRAGVANSAPLILPGESISIRRACCLLANLNSFALDFAARQKVGNVHLNFFIVEQLPVLAPETYDGKCPWNKRQTLENWIADRVLKLSCTANDLRPLAEAASFAPGVHRWNEQERAALTADLDAAFFLLYGIKREDVEYILSTFTGMNQRDDGLFEATGPAQRILEAYDKLADGQGST